MCFRGEKKKKKSASVLKVFSTTKTFGSFVPGIKVSCVPRRDVGIKRAHSETSRSRNYYVNLFSDSLETGLDQRRTSLDSRDGPLSLGVRVPCGSSRRLIVGVYI
ncbi:hypothetical protein PUN28_008087 [Cardiocondyla obscurior]|uniref:Uncharacterized protein n=1 Tax=Cardiocondyla obscurior TaxID=286306 RepID=A0AAW2FY80_9HYME